MTSRNTSVGLGWWLISILARLYIVKFFGGDTKLAPPNFNIQTLNCKSPCVPITIDYRGCPSIIYAIIIDTGATVYYIMVLLS